jgi:hypothetical protein
MSEPISELARRLAAQAEAVCRHYLPNGRREGRYWMIGDIHNTPGRSLFVRLHGAGVGKGAAGKWTEYVAPRIMLRTCGWMLSCGRSAASTQHNSSALAGVA